jgi:F-type H+-transporting ATPase subunit b
MKKIAATVLGLGLFLAPLSFAQEAKEGAHEKAGEKSEEKKGGMEEPSMFWITANFVVLAAVLGYLAVKQGGPFFNARSAEIRKGIDAAEKIKADSNAKIASINAKLGRLDAEIASLRESAANERRGAEQRVKEETRLEIERIRVHAEAEIESAGKSERIALQRYVAQLALELAETKVRARLTPNTEDALVQAFVNGLGSAPARRSPNT